ncbi:MAG: hypothetical protein ABIH99_01950 [Candidatus Micrarchaeota archaeon]
MKLSTCVLLVFGVSVLLLGCIGNTGGYLGPETPNSGNSDSPSTQCNSCSSTPTNPSLSKEQELLAETAKCKQNKDSDVRDSCLYEVALAFGNVAPCNSIYIGIEEEKCVVDVNSQPGTAAVAASANLSREQEILSEIAKCKGISSSGGSDEDECLLEVALAFTDVTPCYSLYSHDRDLCISNVALKSEMQEKTSNTTATPQVVEDANASAAKLLRESIAYCHGLYGLDKNDCFTALAISSSDPSFCSRTDNYYASDCYVAMAIHMKDSSLCELARSERDECVSKVKDAEED